MPRRTRTTNRLPEDKIGPRLRAAVGGLQARQPRGMARLALDLAVDEVGAPLPPALPAALSLPRITPEAGESWQHYKERVQEILAPSQDWLQQNAGLQTKPLFCGNALAGTGEPQQLLEATKHEPLRLVELDPPLQVTCMDDAVRDVELPLFRSRHPTLDGRGVRVAVIDSGIDTLHPWLRVADSISTCKEQVGVPGAHATHVAGALASHDEVYPGIAPGVSLYNVKALDSFGRGEASFITRGIDAALDFETHVISMSVGFNHLPTWSAGGHGWACPDGLCPLCTAVDNAVSLDRTSVVVAAGNEHGRAVALRAAGNGSSFDTELACPGQARQAITVAAITKQTFLTASFSSRGATAYGGNKPDLAAPGVNITSSFPAKRDATGALVPAQTRASLSDRRSGTSMATPVVAGVVALIVQRRLEAGESIAPADVRGELLEIGLRHSAAPLLEVGAGRVCAGDL